MTEFAQKKVRACVVGGGRIGTIHMQNIQRNSRMELVAFIDVDQERANQVKNETGCQTYSSLQELLSTNPDSIDTVIICSPTATHFELVHLSIEHLKPTLCEKPISLDPTEIKKLYDFAAEKNVPLLCGYHRRHDHSFKTLHQMVTQGDIGELRSIRTCSRDNPIPAQNFLKISGGILHDCASHDIDVMRWIVKEEPIEVYASASAFIGRIKELNDWDTVSIHMKFPSGVLGTVDICRSAPYGYDQRIEVLGEHGMLQAENQRPSTVIRSTVNGVTVDPNCFSFPQRYTQTYYDEMDHFVDIILKGVPPAVTGADCYRDAVIIQKCEESVHSGLPVKINFD
jgi:myo-inositol 2-dehydrogenase/D-chiro-inositol 1-dehydrogenase